MYKDYEKLYYAAVKRFSALPRGITCNRNDDFYCSNVLICLEKKINLKIMRTYVKIMIVVT